MYIVYSTSYNQEPTFYGTARTIWDAEAIVNELIDEFYDNNLDKAIRHASQWLRDLSEWKPCTFAPYDVYVDLTDGDTVYYDDMDSVLEDIDFHTYGESIAEYINLRMPIYKIGRTVDMGQFSTIILFGDLTVQGIIAL